MSAAALDFDHLFKLRLVVARVGEMDNAKWWNTKRQLAQVGAMALQRGFPRTYRFAQARAVFAVATQRCAELFSPPGCVTLWALPAAIEDEFEERWQQWLDDYSAWEPFFSKVESLSGTDLLSALRGLELIGGGTTDAVGKLKRSAEGRGVPLPGLFAADDATLDLLAAGFSRGESGSPAVPYARLEG
jgi:hypothetical protein